MAPRDNSDMEIGEGDKLFGAECLHFNTATERLESVAKQSEHFGDFTRFPSADQLSKPEQIEVAGERALVPHTFRLRHVQPFCPSWAPPVF
jgi:hypothetical protein